MRMTRRTRRGAALCALALTMALAATAGATVAPLPADGSQVNNDPANSIDPARDAGVSDVAGGTTTAGNLQVPWAAFEQATPGAQQIFVRAFKAGAWVTEGFPASLNIVPTKQAEGPAIDFAGAGRTVPWVAWYEPNDNLGGGSPTQIFASRFNATTNLWLPSGQDRAPSNQLPSLNVNLGKTAENPAVAGGATTAGADPVPWVAWQERDGNLNDNINAEFQIFVSKAVKQDTVGTPCTGFAPGSGNNVNESAPDNFSFASRSNCACVNSASPRLCAAAMGKAGLALVAKLFSNNSNVASASCGECATSAAIAARRSSADSAALLAICVNSLLKPAVRRARTTSMLRLRS